jgi:hypothetical protein
MRLGTAASVDPWISTLLLSPDSESAVLAIAAAPIHA